MASPLPDTVTARSVELGSISLATCIDAPVVCNTSTTATASFTDGRSSKRRYSGVDDTCPYLLNVVNVRIRDNKQKQAESGPEINSIFLAFYTIITFNWIISYRGIICLNLIPICFITQIHILKSC